MKKTLLKWKFNLLKVKGKYVHFISLNGTIKAISKNKFGQTVKLAFKQTQRGFRYTIGTL